MCDVMQVSFDDCEWSYVLFWPQPGRRLSFTESSIWQKPISWGWRHSQTPQDAAKAELLRAFAFWELRKETINFVMSLRPSVRPCGTPLLPLDEFLKIIAGEVLLDLLRKSESA